MSPYHTNNEFYGRVTEFDVFGHTSLANGVTQQQRVYKVKQLLPRTPLKHQSNFKAFTPD